MRLITLNTWTAEMRDSLLAFVRREALHTDFFCFQEVFNVPLVMESGEACGRTISWFEDLTEALPDFQGIFYPTQMGGEGLATFVKRTLPIEAQGEVFIHRSRDSMIHNDASTLGRNLVWSRIEGRPMYGIANFHGIWTTTGKEDTSERLEQSRKILSCIKALGCPMVLCGDFNLTLETESVRLIEEDMINLVRMYDVTTTRSVLYPRPERYADYIFVSKDIEVRGFEVLPDIVSDHLALLLDFDC